MITFPRFVDPRSRNYTTYHNQLEQYGLSFQRQITQALCSEFPGQEVDASYSISTTGSDGRLEKGPQSKIELVIFGYKEKQKDPETALAKVRGWLGDSLFPEIEFKNVGRLFLSGYMGDINRPYPTRVLDSRFLYGNYRQNHAALMQIATELNLDAGRTIIDKFKDYLRRAKKITREGKGRFKGREVTHFDLNDGVAFYDNESVGIARSSFKQGPLRLVQFGLTSEIMRKIRNKDFDLDLLDHMPQNTVDRILFFETEGKAKLPHQKIESLVDNYMFFLWQYHLAQENWRIDRKKETGFDKIEVKERLKDLTSLVESGILSCVS